jgi:hypothetical protein
MKSPACGKGDGSLKDLGQDGSPPIYLDRRRDTTPCVKTPLRPNEQRPRLLAGPRPCK